MYAIKGDTHLIDLEQTVLMLRRALDFVKKIYKKRGSIFFIVADENFSPRHNNVISSENCEKHFLVSSKQNSEINAVHLNRLSSEIQTVFNPFHHTYLIGESKILTELNCGNL